MSACPFCNPDPSWIIASNPHAFAKHDAFPLTPGHTLIIPKRHIVSLFEATREEQAAMLELLGEMRQQLLTPQLPFEKGGHTTVPDAFNIGINDGAAAGQTVMHLHIHLIPRHAGDTSDPRGGVRWIFPHKAKYWER
jgi:diadenosine tetraphosphate (Ap4A) HIT family hydrolase